MIRLEIKPNESIDKALRRFKKLCDREGLNRDIRKHMYYEKPSEQRKRREREQEKERAKQARLALKRKIRSKKARQRASKMARAAMPNPPEIREG